MLGSLRTLSVSIAAALANGSSGKSSSRRGSNKNGRSGSNKDTDGAGVGVVPPPSAAVDEMTWIFAEQVLAVLINLCEDSEIATRDVSAPQCVEVCGQWPTA